MGVTAQRIRTAWRVTYLLVEEAIQDSNDEALCGQGERTLLEYLGLASRCPYAATLIPIHLPDYGLSQVFEEKGR